MLGQGLAVGVEIAVKELARGVDQAAGGGDEVQKPRRLDQKAAAAALQVEVPHAFAGGEHQAFPVHQIELADAAAEILQQHALLGGSQVKDAQVEAVRLDPGEVEAAIGVVQLCHRALQHGVVDVAQLIHSTVGIVYVIQAVSRINPAAAAVEHIRRIRPQLTDGRQGTAKRRDRHRRSAEQQQDQKYSVESLKQRFHIYPH